MRLRPDSLVSGRLAISSARKSEARYRIHGQEVDSQFNLKIERLTFASETDQN